MKYTRLDMIGPIGNRGTIKIPQGVTENCKIILWIKDYKGIPAQWAYINHKTWWDAQHCAEAGYTYNGYTRSGVYFENIDESYFSYRPLLRLWYSVTGGWKK